MEEVINTKTCSTCKQPKPLSEFHKRRSTRDGLNSYCRECAKARNAQHYAANREQVKARCRTYRKANREKILAYSSSHREAARRSHVRRNYGLELSDVAEMADRQNHTCRICGKHLGPRNVAHIDHNHQTGAVRSLLCNACNVGLGHFRDDPEILASAVSYLEMHADLSIQLAD